MKKLFIASLIMLASVGAALAQQPTQVCDITITGDFDSECIYDFKNDATSEYPNLMIACKHSTVVYTAHVNNNSFTPSGYTWEVYGDVSHTASGNQLTVTWDNASWGMVVVNVANATGDVCTEYSRVKLIDNPTVGATTVPAYTLDPSGDKIIYVCKGSTVQFIDNSTADGSDIAGYNWSCTQAAPAATPNYTIANVQTGDVVHHSVYNNCGCTDDEEYTIVLLEGEVLELDCFGTVCEGATVTYTATSPSCQEYYWYVEGGTLTGGQGTASPTVQWDRPTGGYGVIGLDGVLCGDIACPAMMSRKVPVIQSGLTIGGETDVCVGDAVLYTLPQLGSTEYRWTVTPTAGVDTTMKSNANELRLVFNQAGTYTLNCSYRCDFLDCGPYTAEPLVITVKPLLKITGDERICVANACSLQTSPSVNAEWTAYNMTGGNTVAATATGTSFTHTFTTPGRYLVTAKNASYCGPATFVLNVADLPPAPTAGDLDPDNRHTACQYSGITLAGTPSEPNYSLVWAPACTTATPQVFCGDNVTISYQSDVCDVHVYNYDRVLQCRSANYYVHQVTTLTPAQLNLPTSITVCPGSLIQWGDNEVPDQSGEAMLYEWTIGQNEQELASVVGSHMDNGVVLAVNEKNPIVSPFHVNLKRTYCGNICTTDVRTIYVQDWSDRALTIDDMDTVCVGSDVLFSGYGYDPPYTFDWEAESMHHSGNNVIHNFQHEGVHNVTLRSHPYTYCTNNTYLPTAQKKVVVVSRPMVEGLSVSSSGVISVVPALPSTDYEFAWSYRFTYESVEEPISGDTNRITANNYGTYICTVTDKQTHCSRTVSTIYDGPEPSCSTMSLSGSYNVCTRTLSLSAGHYSPAVTWVVKGGGYSKVVSGTGNRYADITFEDIGIYTITAMSGGMDCHKGKRVQTVDFIPHFEFEPGCNKVTIKNYSQYAMPGGLVYIMVTSNCFPNTPDYITMAVDDTVAVYTPSPFIGLCSFTFTLTGYGTNNNITPCVLDNVELGHPIFPPQFNPASISVSTPANNNQTCDNTPVRLTASLNYTGAEVSSSTWYFGDGSTYTTTGNSVYHTFKATNNYTVNSTIIDNHGCVVQSAPISITSNSNPFGQEYLVQQGLPVCPYVNSINVMFSHSATYYEWWRHKAPAHIVHSNPYLAYLSDDYFVYAVDNSNCQAQATTFVEFLNAPTASIYVEKNGCCVNEEVTLYGGQDPNGDAVTYSWNIAGPFSYSQSGTTPDIVLIPPSAGAYTATLTVTGSNGCSSTTTETITASVPAAAPALSFVGSPCISDAPVQLSATGCAGEVHWSNGSTGATALYNAPGIATAYCYDPAIGCPSETAQVRIFRQPDFDALLTGCYQKCRSWFDKELPVYSLTDNGQIIQWDWRLNNTSLVSGSGAYQDQPLVLPLTGFGSYKLVVGYGGSCSETSPALEISSKELCDCDDLEVTYSAEMNQNENCNLTYIIKVSVCNKSETDYACLGDIELVNSTGFNIVSNDFVSTTLNPGGDCFQFVMEVEVLDIPPATATFRIIDKNCMHCEKEFCVDLMPELNDCVDEMLLKALSVNTDLTNDVAAYLDFTLDISPCDGLMGMWSEPPMLVDYYTAGTVVYGLGMIDLATLSQLLGTEENVCFHAITCCKGTFCHNTICIEASELCQLIEAAGVRVEGWNGNGGDSEMMLPRGMENPDIQLMPNPATGSVEVTGTLDEILEVLVMDMHGRNIATFDNTASFDVSTLSAGGYIVRVKTRHDEKSDEKITYLKLIKR